MKIFIFSAGEFRADHLRIVVARDRDQAEGIILADKEDPVKRHLREQMRYGIYKHCKTLRHALREYFSVVTEKKIVSGTVFGVRGGDPIFLNR